MTHGAKVMAAGITGGKGGCNIFLAVSIGSKPSPYILVLIALTKCCKR